VRWPILFQNAGLVSWVSLRLTGRRDHGQLCFRVGGLAGGVVVPRWSRLIRGWEDAAGLFLDGVVSGMAGYPLLWFADGQLDPPPG